MDYLFIEFEIHISSLSYRAVIWKVREPFSIYSLVVSLNDEIKTRIDIYFSTFVYPNCTPILL
jgi:hypothetical protein